MKWLSNPDAGGLIWLFISFVLSGLLTWLAIRYARRINLVDLPGQRRSHSIPTPRGGGIAVVVCVLIGLSTLSLWIPEASLPLRFMVSIVLIALIGWIDDHRPLPAWLRLLVHFIAVAIWLAPLIMVVWSAPATASLQFETSRTETAGIALLLMLLTLWSINLHNFMDGIDGLLATQAIFVLVVLALLGLRDAGSVHPLQLGMWAAAIAGFLPFNFPRARVFMGDVGSGVVGLLIAVAIVWQTAMPEIAAATGFIAVSAFATDATCTLLSRMLSGRRWYRPHREHLYQWMTRTGMSHARVVAFYMSWNVVIVAPVLWWINHRVVLAQEYQMSMESGVQWAVGVYALAIALWICGKRWCLRRVKAGGVKTGLAHAAA